MTFCRYEKDVAEYSPSSERDCIPYNLKLLISMILYGPTLKSKENINSQACLTVAQIILFNTKKKNRSSSNQEPTQSGLRASYPSVPWFEHSLPGEK